MTASRQVLALFAAIAFAGVLAGCGDTWHGLKKDTGENLKKAGETLEKAGDSVSK
tara:strand:+ start:136 stop:300 length:165 start_codon:yes stop_codon:yes gene_type:complete